MRPSRDVFSNFKKLGRINVVKRVGKSETYILTGKERDNNETSAYG
jgi:hypothetical protein